MPHTRITLTRFIIEKQGHHPQARGQFSALLDAIATACKCISNVTGRGALAGTLDDEVGENVHGEPQKRLDVLSDEIMRTQTGWGGQLAAIASEEMEHIQVLESASQESRYLLVFDPLDGSSNIDVNITVGTIFSVLHRPDPSRPAVVDDFLQPGTEQVCAGYVLYGPATMLVLTVGDGVHGFTLDRDLGEFVLTHPDLRIPPQTREFAINSSNSRFWEPAVKRYVDECLAGRNGPREKDFNMRWIASLVAETHRILVRGGVFLYPRDSRQPQRPGRLRLLYEANPIAFIVEQAGGACSTGRGRMLEVVPESLHQRVPLIFGSSQEVEAIERYHQQADDGTDQEYRSPLFNERSLFSSSWGPCEPRPRSAGANGAQPFARPRDGPDTPGGN
jgi:fructose-1,6-bisphosphatase